MTGNEELLKEFPWQYVWGYAGGYCMSPLHVHRYRELRRQIIDLPEPRAEHPAPTYVLLSHFLKRSRILNDALDAGRLTRQFCEIPLP